MTPADEAMDAAIAAELERIAAALDVADLALAMSKAGLLQVIRMAGHDGGEGSGPILADFHKALNRYNAIAPPFTPRKGG